MRGSDNFNLGVEIRRFKQTWDYNKLGKKGPCHRKNIQRRISELKLKEIGNSESVSG